MLEMTKPTRRRAHLVREVDIQSFLVCQFLNLFPFKLASHACCRLLERSNSLSIPIHCMMATAVAGPSTKPVQPFYCGVCSLPTEYCEFGPSITKCKTWLENEDQGEFSRLWGEGESPAVYGEVSACHSKYEAS